mgnify:FL=1
MASFSDRLKHAWNAFSKEDSEDASPYFNYGMSYGSYGGRPDRIRFGTANDKSIINTIYNQIGIDVASVGLSHVRLDPEKRYIETIDSGLNNCLTLEANLDQAARAFMQDVAMTMFDKGVIAIVPVDTTLNPRITGAFDVKTLRVGEITAWYPKDVRVSLYNGIKGRKEEVTLAKNFVAIVENPLYMVMNEPNSTLKRLTRKLSLLDSIDEQTGAGKLDLIIQLPYVIKSDARRLQAETRRKDIELQLRGSQYGIAYTDGTERITQLNRPLENNMLKQIEYLTSNLYNQLGMTEAVFNGTADEKTLLNYHNRTIEPILSAIAQAMKRSFLTKTARSQGQSIEFFRDPFKNISISDMAEVADKFTRNEILTSNEVRAAMGLKPANDPKADELRNKNIPEAKQPGFDQSQPEPPSESF